MLGEYLKVSLRIKRSHFQPAQRHTPTHNLRKTQGHKRKETEFSLKLLSVKKAMNMSSKTTGYEGNKEAWELTVE